MDRFGNQTLKSSKPIVLSLFSPVFVHACVQVAQLNSRDSTYVLKDSLYKELQKDWPGYTSGDQQLLKRILVR